MAINVLYLDKLNENMEKMLLERCNNPNIDVRFLNPTIGKKGELKDADILIDTTYRVTKDIIDAVPKLKLIQRTGIGVDMVDVKYAKKKGIPISVCRGFNSNAVAELAVLYMLSLLRRLPVMDATTKKGEWHTWTYRHESYELAGKTVGVLGAGAIGRKVIKKVKALGANVIYYDVFRQNEEVEKELDMTFKEIDEVIAEADVLTLHLPLLPSTRHIIGTEQFKKMKNTAVLVNSARDALVDLPAMVEALRNKEIMGAAIDIFDPVKEDSPFINVEGFNLILTPHIGAATFDNYDRVYKLCAKNALKVFNGEEPDMLLE